MRPLVPQEVTAGHVHASPAAPASPLGVGRGSHTWLSEVWTGGLSASGPPTGRRARMAVQETREGRLWRQRLFRVRA